jgi:hypothetical protein
VLIEREDRVRRGPLNEPPAGVVDVDVDGAGILPQVTGVTVVRSIHERKRSPTGKPPRHDSSSFLYEPAARRQSDAPAPSSSYTMTSRS